MRPRKGKGCSRETQKNSRRETHHPSKVLACSERSLLPLQPRVTRTLLPLTWDSHAHTTGVCWALTPPSMEGTERKRAGSWSYFSAFPRTCAHSACSKACTCLWTLGDHARANQSPGSLPLGFHSLRYYVHVVQHQAISRRPEEHPCSSGSKDYASAGGFRDMMLVPGETRAAARWDHAVCPTQKGSGMGSAQS